MRSLETLAVNIQNTKAEIRLEVVGSSRKPSLVAVKKEKAALSDDVPFDDVRLVVNASGGYQLFVYRSVQNADCRLQAVPGLQSAVCSLRFVLTGLCIISIS